MACGGAEFESELFVGAGGTAGTAGDSGGAAGAPADAGKDGAFCEGLYDNNACTIDECNPDTGEVVHVPIPGIDDQNACTIDTCDPLTAEVTHTNVPVDDGKACTYDACDGATGNIIHNEIPPGWQCNPCGEGQYEVESKLNCGWNGSGYDTLGYLCALTC